jgi:pimeloyl-ACP methyl ester carboxylesterase
VSSTARRNFDLVSFDPRGVGESTPLWCYRGAQLDDFLDIDPTPDSVAEGVAMVQAGVDLARACKTENAQLMAHLSTAEIARDMDVLRGLLGEARLRYLGKSWGSALGTVYAALFPGRVGSFVLDGAVDLQTSPVQALMDQGRGFEVAIDRFIAWCLNQGTCPLGANKSLAKARLVTFLAGLDSQPLPTGDADRPLTEAQALTAIIGPMYVTGGGFDWLLTALTPAIELGKGRPLQTISDWFVSRNADGTYGANANTVIYAVNCLDGPAAIRSAAQARTLQARWRKQLPVMGAAMAWGDLPCAKWPYRAGTDISKLHVRKVPPILVVSATLDPATPMKWGRALARELPKSVLLIREGDGHTSYANNNLCIDRVVDAFLLSASPARPDSPASGKRCA